MDSKILQSRRSKRLYGGECMRKRKIYTDEEIAHMVVGRTLKKTWETIADEIEVKFGYRRSPANLSFKYNSLIGLDFSNYYTDKQTQFVYAAWLNNFPMKKIIAGFEEQFQQKINKDNVDFIVKQMNHEQKVKSELTETKNKIKQNMEMKKMKKNAWTKEEDEQLLACGSWKKAMELDNGRSRSAKNQRWSFLQKQQTKNGLKRGRLSQVELGMIRNCETVEEAIALNLRKPETITKHFLLLKSDSHSHKEWKKKEAVLAVEPKQKVHGNKGRKYSPRWTKEEDYDLILNFYELSIDEARNRFNRPYGAIATRLEKLVDSTKPEHISMLMEASKEIKARKQSQAPKPKKSRRMRRKERKQAKKTAKLEAKLNRLRGE